LFFGERDCQLLNESKIAPRVRHLNEEWGTLEGIGDRRSGDWGVGARSTEQGELRNAHVSRFWLSGTGHWAVGTWNWKLGYWHLAIGHWQWQPVQMRSTWHLIRFASAFGLRFRFGFGHGAGDCAIFGPLPLAEKR